MICALEQESRSEMAEFLDTLRRENRLTFKAIYACEREHRDEIGSMDRIFRLETEEDIRRCLALPQLLDPENADALVDYFCSKHRDNQVVSTTHYHSEGYKVLLLTAFIFNPPFFAMAWNWCSLYRHELRMQMLREQEHRESGNDFTVVHGKDPSPIVNLGRPNLQEAASGTGIRVIGRWPQKDGELRMVEHEGGVEFIFKFSQTADTSSYHIEVTGSGQKEPVQLNRIRGNPRSKEFTSGKITWNDLNMEILINRKDNNNA